MSLTRLQLVTDARDAADAEDATRWTPTGVLRRMDVAFQREWTDLLNASPFLRTAVVSVTVDANGNVPFASLTYGTGDSLQRFYRLIVAIDANGELSEGDLRDNALARQANVAGLFQRRYWFSGTNISFSNDLIGQSVTFTFSVVPQLPSQLATDDSTIDFPSPYEYIIALETAALMMMKGGTETDASEALHGEADVFRSKLEGDVGRRSIQPQSWRTSDNAADWASQ